MWEHDVGLIAVGFAVGAFVATLIMLRHMRACDRVISLLWEECYKASRELTTVYQRNAVLAAVLERARSDVNSN